MKFCWAILFWAVTTFASASPVPGTVIPEFTLKTRQGVPWHWTHGKTTVFTFCALWCDTWKDQLPRVAGARRAVAGLPVDFVAISVDGRWLDKAADRQGVILDDSGSNLTRRLGVDRVPCTVLVNPSGVVTWAEYGTIRSQDLTDAIRNAEPSASNAFGKKIAYLTFDDFPAPRLSFELLDELRALDVPATLFCICSHFEGNPELVRQLLRQGIHPQIHSWDHNRDHPEIDRCIKMLVQAGFAAPLLYRPPGSEKVYMLGGSSLSLSVDDPYDFTHPGSAEICRRVLLAAHDRSVIQLHAGVQDTLDALPSIVQNLRARGFVFRSLDDKSVDSS